MKHTLLEMLMKHLDSWSNILMCLKKAISIVKGDSGLDLFGELKHRFLSFKKHKYLEESEHFQNLAKAQSPKFMVIGCVDSRVYPSNILGFQPGEAFMIRNVANLVPRLENGRSETNAALEFAVNILEVENIFVIGHSSCAGIEALMSMQDGVHSSSFIEKWVVNAKVAKSITKAAAAHISFDQQCRHCEKVLDGAQVSMEEYEVMKDLMIPLGRAPQFSAQSGG